MDSKDAFNKQVTIAAKRGRPFWRCGIQHTQTPVTYAANHFTKAQIEQMQKDKMLVVTVGTKHFKQSATEQSATEVSHDHESGANEPIS